MQCTSWMVLCLEEKDRNWRGRCIHLKQDAVVDSKETQIIRYSDIRRIKMGKMNPHSLSKRKRSKISFQPHQLLFSVQMTNGELIYFLSIHRLEIVSGLMDRAAALARRISVLGKSCTL